jgi:hypothetical protein
MLFQHVGFKPLWPVVFFLPWLLFGVALVVESVRHRRFGVSAPQAMRLAGRSPEHTHRRRI